MKRRIISLITSIIFVFLFITSSAELHTGPSIILSGTGVNVPNEVIEQLVKDYPDAKNIRITAWHSSTTPPELDVLSTATSGWGEWVYDSVTMNTAQRNATLNDLHVITCATGVQKTLVTSFEKDFSSSVSISSSIGVEDEIKALTAADLGIERTVSVSISETSVYSGPPAELTDVNSREYRVRWYGNVGGWTGVVRHTGTNQTQTVYGSWVEYVGAAEYYVDRYISPLQ